MPHDIFLSYATSEDTLLAKPWGGQDTWVRCFKVALQQAVDRELGRTSSASWFLDAKDIRTGDELEGRIKRALDQTALFVALLSPGYFHKESWCHLEREYFIASLGPDAARQGRVFGVLLDEGVLAQWKELCFPTVRAFPFFEKNLADETNLRLGEGEIDATFLKRLNTLAEELAERIRAIRVEPPREVPRVAPAPSKGTVYLAATPGEIEEQRTELAIALTGDNWSVVPDVNECDPDPRACETQALELANRPDVVAFLQILGPHPWLPGNHDVAQAGGAAKSGKPVWIYRTDEFDLSKVKNEAYRTRLSGVAARSLPRLKDEVLGNLARLLASRAPTAPPGVDSGDIAFVTVIASPAGPHAVQEHLREKLEQALVYARVPDDPRAALENTFLKEHGLVTVFGNETYSRIERDLLDWRELLIKYRRKAASIPPIAVFLTEPPPNDKRAALNMSLPGLHVLDWNDEPAFGRFVDRIKRFAAAQTPS